MGSILISKETKPSSYNYISGTVTQLIPSLKDNNTNNSTKNNFILEEINEHNFS